MNLKKIIPQHEGLINVIIETPAGSKTKYNYNEELEVFELSKVLPTGMIFPFDFGFIPNTKGEDGDPLDVLVLMDEPGYPGCMAACRVAGILQGLQTERDGKTMRNDRIIGIAAMSGMYKSVANLTQLNEHLLKEIEQFFINYNTQAGKQYEPIGWGGADDVAQLIRSALTR